MGKLYTRPSQEEKFNNLNPNKETIKFLLSYSKALRITEYHKLQFDTLLN